MRCYEPRRHNSICTLLAIMATLVLLTADRVDAQQLMIPGGSTEAETIARAEAEGAAYPRVAAPAAFRAMFAPDQKGTAERRCVEGIELGPVRSGEFVIGGNLGGSRAMRAGKVARPGRWLLIATSGNNWGCFILTVR